MIKVPSVINEAKAAAKALLKSSLVSRKKINKVKTNTSKEIIDTTQYTLLQESIPTSFFDCFEEKDHKSFLPFCAKKF